MPSRHPEEQGQRALMGGNVGGKKVSVTGTERVRTGMGARSGTEVETYSEAGASTGRARPRVCIPTAVGKPLKSVSSRVTGWVSI